MGNIFQVDTFTFNLATRCCTYSSGVIYVCCVVDCEVK